MATNIGRGYYVPNIYLCAKLHFDPIREFPPPTYTKLPTKCLLGYFFGFLKLTIPKTAAPILTRTMSKDVVSRKDATFGVRQTIFYILTQFSRENGKFVAIFDGQNFGSIYQ